MAKKRKSSSSRQKQTATTTVKSSGSQLLSKVGSFVKKALPIAANLLPGPIGTVAKVLSGNDPEWWSAPGGEEVATNQPYAGTIDTTVTGLSPVSKCATPRFEILEVISSSAGTDVEISPVIALMREHVDTYILPHVRKVVNAVYLRTTQEYRTAVETGATIYAFKKTLEKWRFMTKESQPVYANLIMPQFPAMMPVNKSRLDALIKSLEEKLRGSVRLPATLCRYIDWRFGRVFKSNPSKKSGLVIYDYVGVYSTMDSLEQYAQALFDRLTSVSQANVDIFNAFMGHTQDIEVPCDHQYLYDAKEFVLRTNMDTGLVSGFNSSPNVVVMDSELDNKTVFMASTVSIETGDDNDGSVGYTQQASGATLTPLPQCLFAVRRVLAWAYAQVGDTYLYSQDGVLFATPGAGGISLEIAYPPNTTSEQVAHWWGINLTESTLNPHVMSVVSSSASGTTVALPNESSSTQRNAWIPYALLACKQLDYYNAGIYVSVGVSRSGKAGNSMFDITSIDIDTALVPEKTIAMEQKYAVANLFSSRAHYAGKNTELKELKNDVQELVNQTV